MVSFIPSSAGASRFAVLSRLFCAVDFSAQNIQENGSFWSAALFSSRGLSQNLPRLSLYLHVPPSSPSRGLSAVQIAAGALREHGPRVPPGEASTASAFPSSTGGPVASSSPPSGPTAAGAVSPSDLVVGSAPLRRRASDDEEGRRREGEGVEMVADGGGGAAGGGSVVGGGVFSRRQSSNGGAVRQQSVEDDLWGWFGDDRPPPETALRGTPRSIGDGVGTRAGVGIGDGGSGGGGGGMWPRESTAVTVSTLALTERLAKLSAGRVLLDRVRADTRSLASVVSSAARSAFSGLGSCGGGGDDRGPDGATPAAPPPAAGVDVSSLTSVSAPRAVQFTEGSPPGGGSPRRARSAAQTRSETTTPTAAEAVENGDMAKERVAGSGGGGGGGGEAGRAGALRRRVVAARAELEGLQREIRRLVREGGGGDAGLREETRARVAPLVERRAVLARSARADAERMAERLQEISEAQQVGFRRGDRRVSWVVLLVFLVVSAAF